MPRSVVRVYPSLFFSAFMTQLIECVPNISEGRRVDVIASLQKSISEVRGVHLLHTDSSKGANRTVFTFVGDLENIAEAAFRLIKQASESIDMNVQKGEHPRLGAADVIPFIPLINSTMEECVHLTRNLGERVASELNIPVFLYEYAAIRKDRIALPDVRRGQYEGLATRTDPPDYIPKKEGPPAGASIIGARDILIAFNVSLNERTPLKIAKKIASEIRKIPYLRAIGWTMPEYNTTQVSCNLLNYKVTGFYEVITAIETLAKEFDTSIIGSELIGLCTEESLEDASIKFKITGEDEKKIRETAERIGLNYISPFIPHERILDRQLSLRGLF